jgi:hypothetical protein
MTQTEISQRHRILIAAAAAAMAASRMPVRKIAPAGWTRLRPGDQPVQAVPGVRVHIRTIRKEQALAATNFA